MLLRFTKMHGLGNDFVVIDLISQRARLSSDRIRQIADRKFGIGCDQVLLIEPPETPDADFRYRIFNADGHEVEQCGNGARCFARYVFDNKLTASKHILVETLGGLIELVLNDDGTVSVNMGVPELAPAKIPFTAAEQAVTYPLQVNETTCEISAVSMGNPHAVLLVDNVDTAPVAALGASIERHGRFPRRVNVGFMQVLDRNTIRLRVFERGVGETLACGTGACAAVVAGQLRGLLDTKVTVQLRGGNLTIDWPGIGKPVTMTGPAVTVFRGQIKL